MKEALLRLLAEQKPAMTPCAECPVKGACVYVTPAYEPGYCLHEYKLLHAFLARRLRAHPPAGAHDFAALTGEGEQYAAWLRAARPFDARRPHAAEIGSSDGPFVAWPGQKTLEAFVAA